MDKFLDEFPSALTEDASKGGPSAMESREDEAAKSNNDCADAAADDKLKIRKTIRSVEKIKCGD